MRSLLEPVQKTAFPTSPDKKTSGQNFSVNRSWLHFDQFLQRELQKRNKQKQDEDGVTDDLVFVEQTLERLLQKAKSIHELSEHKEMHLRLLELWQDLRQKSGNLFDSSITPALLTEYRASFSNTYLKTQNFFSNPGGYHYTGTL